MAGGVCTSHPQCLLASTYEKSVFLNSPLTLISSVLSLWAHCTSGDTLKQNRQKSGNFTTADPNEACIDRYRPNNNNTSNDNAISAPSSTTMPSELLQM